MEAIGSHEQNFSAEEKENVQIITKIKDNKIHEIRPSRPLQNQAQNVGSR
jgi:hypothetical protein